MKMYLVVLDWHYGADYGLDVNHYTTYDDALEAFLQSIEEEMSSSWISDYVTAEGKIDTDMCEFETNLDLKNKEERSLYWAVKQPENYKVDDLQLLILEVQ